MEDANIVLHNQNSEDFVIIWLGTNNVESDLKSRLRHIVNCSELFNDPDECIDYISSITKEKVFFIISDSFARNMIPLVYELPQIFYIYVFYSKNHNEKEQNDNYLKVRGVFFQKDSLVRKLSEDVIACSNCLTPISMLNLANEKPIRDLLKDNVTFMWYQLLIKILPLMSKNEIRNDVKSEMVKFCREQYNENPIVQQKIHEFDKDYSSDKAIGWYIQDSFVYRLLNKAFRTENIDIIFQFRFFIADLHQQLSKLHPSFVHSLSGKTFRTYRGQGLLVDELEKLKHNIGQLISINSFYSMSTNREVALLFAGDGEGLPQIESILFEIAVNTNITTTAPYANIAKQSFMDGEDEILLSMGAIFRISSIHKESGTNVWIMTLLLVGSNDDDPLKQLTNELGNQIGNEPTILTLGKLLAPMGEQDKAGRYYQMLVNKKPTDPHIVASLYNNLASVYYSKGNDTLALATYQKVLEVSSKYRWANHPSLASTYNNIGLIYFRQGDCETTLKNYEKTLSLLSPSDPILAAMYPYDHPLRMNTYMNIAGIHDSKGEYAIALKYLRMTLESRRRTLNKNHPELADTYNNIGYINNKIGEYSTTLFNYEKALEI
ncbi:unnamed protein product [Didymodactylos carnosus]|uniref:Uncharacterized protein n=1 Tax=Didymodactylos carnosus TaxID=1234261 RepID=A0A814IZ13_9BILA|nr:unnamed protein product [Didymodactylos carnosus]CAF1028328.1 unnamed protein product [Didymodactylos carnosus]CAF3516867.1 unnamed protein product [Didymodactylos carnosus]CAF3799320.1 unnamed protein product [Didymodactylos carnosus]